jgi:hypothetical protein
LVERFVAGLVVTFVFTVVFGFPVALDGTAFSFDSFTPVFAADSEDLALVGFDAAGFLAAFVSLVFLDFASVLAFVFVAAVLGLRFGLAVGEGGGVGSIDSTSDRSEGAE